MNGSLPLAAVITNIRRLTCDTTLFTLTCTGDAEARTHDVASFLPGQFLELSLPGMGEVPISYCGLPRGDSSIELCIRHLGHVTMPLQLADVGDPVGVRGPFGQGFPLESYVNRDLLLIAGGLGMAPLRSLLLALLARRPDWGELTLLYGSREPGAILFLDELMSLAKRSDIRILLAVDHPDPHLPVPPNCSVALLPALLESLSVRPERTFAALCGPPVVYPFLLAGLKRLGLTDERIHLSLERRMKCGLGRCGHCGVGSFLCCTDGPVFSSARLQGIEGALT